MRVLVNALSVAPGGGLAVAAGLLDELARLKNADYTVLVKDGLLEDSCQKADTIRFLLAAKGGANPVTRTVWEQLCLPKTMRDGNYDLLFGVGGFGMLRGEWPQVVIIQNSLLYVGESRRSILSRIRRRVQRWYQLSTLANGARGICVSQSIRKEVVRFARGNVSLSIIPNGVPDIVTRVDPSDQSDEDQLTILWIGSEGPHKNPMDLIDALVHVEQEIRHPIEVHLVGALSDTLRQSLADQAASLDLATSLSFLGPLSRQEVDAELRNATVLVSTSRIEASPLPPLEAIAIGTPTVLSDISAHREIAPESPLYPVGQPAELGQHLAALLEDSVLRREIAEVALLQVQGRTWRAAAVAYRREFDLAAEAQSARE